MLAGTGQCNSCYTPPHYIRHWAVELGCDTLVHCLGEVGNGTATAHFHSAMGAAGNGRLLIRPHTALENGTLATRRRVAGQERAVEI